MKYLALPLLLLACENPAEHFTESKPKQKEYIIPESCLSQPDSTTYDAEGREHTAWSCKVGEPTPKGLALPPR